MELIFILTYDCNFRCKYCDIHKRNQDISKDILVQSLKFLEANNFEIEKVKFFGGEPLLKKEFITYIINNFPSKYSPNYYITTNTTLIDDDFVQFSIDKKVKLTFSIDGNNNTNSENRILMNGLNVSDLVVQNTKKYSKNIRVNQVITSKNAINFFENFKYLYDIGVRKFNFLPEYYNDWSKTGLTHLKKGFDEISKFYSEGNTFELINLENFSEISFFNLGLVIDTDGSIYGTNLILSGIFEPYKDLLRIGTISSGITFDIFLEKNKYDYINRIEILINNVYSKSILNSKKYVDFILNDFCYTFKK